MSECIIPKGITASIIDEPSCLIESEGKKYIQFSQLESSTSKPMFEQNQLRAEGRPYMNTVVKEVVIDTYTGGDVNGDGFPDQAIVTTTINSRAGGPMIPNAGEPTIPNTEESTIPNTVKMEVLFNQEKKKGRESKTEFLNSTDVFKSLDTGRTTHLPFTIWRNNSESPMYSTVYPIPEDKSVLWVSVPEDPK